MEGFTILLCLLLVLFVINRGKKHLVTIKHGYFHGIVGTRFRALSKAHLLALFVEVATVDRDLWDLLLRDHLVDSCVRRHLVPRLVRPILLHHPLVSFLVNAG